MGAIREWKKSRMIPECFPWASGNMELLFIEIEKSKEEDTWEKRSKVCMWLGMVAHTCNPSYLGGRHWEDHGLRPAWVKSYWDPIPNNSLVWWQKPVIPVTQGSLNERITLQASTGKNMRPYPQNTKSKENCIHAEKVYCLPNKCKALSSNSGTSRKRSLYLDT
jgi:hypothetical protein